MDIKLIVFRDLKIFGARILSMNVGVAYIMYVLCETLEIEAYCEYTLGTKN